MNDSNLVQKFISISERILLFIIAVATLYATAYEIMRMIDVKIVNLSDLFLLFIYAEVLGMVATFYVNNRIHESSINYIGLAPTGKAMKNLEKALGDNEIRVRMIDIFVYYDYNEYNKYNNDNK